MKITDIEKTEIITNLPATVSLAGKSWEDNGRWCQSIIISDGVGSMRAEYHQLKYNPLIKGNAITIIKARKPTKKLYQDAKLIIEEVELFTTMADNIIRYDQEPDWDAISRGKIRHGLVCAAIKSAKLNIVEKGELDIGKVGRLVNYIMSGIMQ